MNPKRMMWGILASAAVALVVPLSSCVRPAEQRAQKDLEVGIGATESLVVQVEGGLAAIRHLSPGELVIWAGAPQLTVHLAVQGESAEIWTVEVWNCMPDAEVRASAGGDQVPVEREASGIATRKKWLVQLPPTGSVRVEIGPDDSSDQGPWRFAVLSDVQEAVDRVQDIFARVNEDSSIRFLLGAGDLTEQGSAEEMDRFQNELLTLRVPYFSTLGNHELFTSPTPWHAWFGRGNFRFTFRGVQFSMLDSGSATVDPTVYDWLDSWLAEAKNGVHIVATHTPPIDPVGVRNGSFASRNEAAKLLARLADGKVDHTFYGHIHSYYGFENAGIPATISGGGGAIPERWDGIGRHFMMVDVDPNAQIVSTSVVRVDP